MKEKQEFIKRLKYKLSSSSFEARDRANLGLLGFDLGRAKNDEEAINAKYQYNYRLFRITGNSHEESIKLCKTMY